MTPAPVLAAQQWASNADLIADVARLYLRRDMVMCDVTYGRGLWWKLWRPDTLVCHDKYKGDGVDFRDLPEPDRTYDAVAFDPPYVSVGGRATSTIPEFNDRFGLVRAARTPATLQADINAGLSEVYRVTKPGGIALVKCMDYVSGGKLWLGTHLTMTAALSLPAEDGAPPRGFRVLDRFEHIAKSGRAQPATRKVRARDERGRVVTDGEGKPVWTTVPTRQEHARRNLSTLLVLQRPPKDGRRAPAAVGAVNLATLFAPPPDQFEDDAD